jgi:hypothetical protein
MEDCAKMREELVLNPVSDYGLVILTKIGRLFILSEPSWRLI